jgi:hypothetical protein
MKRLLLLSLVSCVSLCFAVDRPAILFPRGATAHITLAAKEIRRYVLLRTGVLADLIEADTALPSRPYLIVLAPARSGLLNLLSLESGFRDSLAGMPREGHCLRTVSRGKSQLLVISGTDEIATLYGAYSFVEKLGVRFTAYGDIIPDGTMPFSLPDLAEWHAPLFATRGLQPFHDFPEGPDWWNLDDYKAMFTQMVKMKLNFFGLHTYPQGGVGPEPTVWIGFTEDILPEGRVISSYPARYFTTTGDPAWGYNPRKTGDYFWGLGRLFEKDSYGPEIMNGFTPHAHIGTYAPFPSTAVWKLEPRLITGADWNELFARTAGLFSPAFRFGRDLGIKMCVGTETPLVVPDAVKTRAHTLGKDTTESLLRQQLYKGIFERIKQTFPIDYFWFWTPEDWTWSGNNEQQVKQTRNDLEAAQRAALAVQAPFTLATCGWVLGPKEDRAMFDRLLPESWAVSCINREVGYEPVDPDFAKITGRPRWAIPWLEDDPALILPQLWVGRLRRDAADACAYGCTGLIGIHWRTRVLGPNISALAEAGWRQEGWNPWHGKRITPEQAVARSRIPERDLPSLSFYRNWAEASFGAHVADSIAALFSSLDGAKRYDKVRAGAASMPVPADWVQGPGGIKPDTLTWEARRKDYRFVDDFQKLRGAVTGPENLERFDYWLNTFSYLRSTGRFACTTGQILRLIDTAKKDSLAGPAAYRQSFIDLRARQMQELEEVLLFLLHTVSSNGELGTMANWQQHIMTLSVYMPGRTIDSLLGQPLPDKCWPSRTPVYDERIIVPTVRTSLNKGEDFRLKVIVPAREIHTARLFLKTFASQRADSSDLVHVNRAVWQARIPGAEITEDFEYYLEVTTPNGILRYPAGAPDRNSTVVVY